MRVSLKDKIYLLMVPPAAIALVLLASATLLPVRAEIVLLGILVLVAGATSPAGTGGRSPPSSCRTPPTR